MRSILSQFVLLALLTACAASPRPPHSSQPGPKQPGPKQPGPKQPPLKRFVTDERAAAALKIVEQRAAQGGYGTPKCTLEKAAVRRDWDTFSPEEKKEYIRAVKCLQTKPSITPREVAPGARSRYDDFVVTHINQTLSIHGTANFLSWHRYYTWTYEKALRDECQYKGYQAYYNWPRWAADPLKAPVFDGSDTSMSGNGKFKEHADTFIPNALNKLITIPAGPGGDCVQDGPFKDFVVNLGPVAGVLPFVNKNPLESGLGHNPRCLRRDINAAATSKWSTDEEVVSLIDNNDEIYWFQTIMQGEFPKGFLGVHTAGHFTVGGDPGGDLFASSGDPFFFLHHSMIDRVWWTWQNLKPDQRTNVVSGTHTINNNPPSENGTLAEIIELGLNAPGITIEDASSTLTGAPFCYIYK